LANDGETRQAGTPGLYSPAQHSVNHRTERRSGSIIGLASWAPHRWPDQTESVFDPSSE